MTRDQIYTFVTSLLFGYQLNTTFFNSMLDTAQDEVEGIRPWMILRNEDSTNTIGTNSSFTTGISLPADFRKWYGKTPVVLVDSRNNPLPFDEIPLAEKYNYKSAAQKFYTDHVAKQFFLCGAITQSYTAHLYYIKKGTQVSASANNVWGFDAYGYGFSNILGVLIALQYKGVDYDIINIQNAGQLGQMAQKILDVMTRWDSELQASAQQGYDPFDTGGGWIATAGGGRMI